MIVEVPGTDIKFDVREDYDTDNIVIHEIWEENVYEVKGWNFFREDTGQEVVIDIGANIGSFSIYAAHNRAKVYAVEPEPNNYEALVNNIELNNMQEKITPVKLGISDYNGTAIISNEGGGATILDGKSGASIKVITLDKFIKDNNITSVGVLKIDVEGSEQEIILGASKETLNICKYITIEFDVRTGKFLGDMVKKLSETHHIRTMGSWERGGMIFAWLY